MHTTPLQRKHNAIRRARKPPHRVARFDDGNCNKPFRLPSPAYAGNLLQVAERKLATAATAAYLRRDYLDDFDVDELFD